MADLSGVLGQVPFLAGWKGTDQLRQQEQAGQLAQAQNLMGILSAAQQQQQRQAAAQREEQFRGALGALGPSPTQEQLAQVASRFGTPDAIMRTQQGSLDRAAQRDNAAAMAAAAREERKAALEARLADAATTREERAALQRELLRMQMEGRRDLLGVAASLRPPRAEPAVQPLVQIMGPDNQPMWVERKDAVGKTPAGAGSKAEAQIQGKSDVDKDVVKLKSVLDTLKSGGGITDTSKGTLENIGASISSSAVGQMAGGAVGSENQSARNQMLMIRPSLLRSIMSSTGMSAKQMDSNAELKLWLSTATDPTKDYQANIQALNNIAAKYGSGAFLEGGTTQTSGKITPANPQRRSSDNQTLRFDAQGNPVK